MGHGHHLIDSIVSKEDPGTPVFKEEALVDDNVDPPVGNGI